MKNNILHRHTVLSRMIFSNATVIFVGNIFKNIIAFLVSIRMARYLGVSEFGVFSYVFTFIYLFDMLPKLGMDSILVREIAHDKKEAQSLLNNALGLRIIFAFLGMLLVFIIITAVKGFSKVSFLVYLSSFSLLFSIQLIYETMFRVDLKMLFPVSVNIIKSIVYMVLVFSLIYLKSNLYGFVIASILSGFFALWLIIRFSYRYFVIYPRIDLKTCKWLCKESLPLLLSGIFTLIYTRIDVILLEAIKGFEAVGFYSVAHKFLDAIVIIPAAAATSLFPLMSRFYKEDIHQFRRICAFGLKYMLMFILPVIVGTLFFADRIIVIYGKAFMDSFLSLKLLIISALFTFLNIILVNAVIAIGRQKIDAYISGISVILNVCLNLILIPVLSFNGASLVVIITELFGFIVLLVSLLRITGLAISDMKIPHLLGANIFFFIFLWLARPLSFIWILVISAVVYTILMLLFNILRRDLRYFLGVLEIQRI